MFYQQPCYPCYFNRPYYLPNMYMRQYPDVDPTSFTESAIAFRALMSDASQLFGALAESEKLAHDMMDAAQVNDKERVQQLIATTGVEGNVDVSYTPDGLTLEMHTQAEGTECCRLTMVLRW